MLIFCERYSKDKEEDTRQVRGSLSQGRMHVLLIKVLGDGGTG